MNPFIRSRGIALLSVQSTAGLQSETKTCSDTEDLAASATSYAGLTGSSDRCCALRTGGHGEEQSIMKFTFQNPKVHLLDSQKPVLPVTAVFLTRRGLPVR
jgi:hypothetical protein